MKNSFLIKIQKIRETIKQFIESERFASVSYFPFIGWLFPMYMKENNDFSQNNAKQAFLISAVMLGVDFTLLCLDFFLPINLTRVSLVIILTIYVLLILYFIIMGYCAWKSYKGVFPRLFLISDYSEELNL